MTPEAIASLMAAALPDLRPWTADEVAEAMSAPGAVAVVTGEGFALGRAVADEAELYAIAVRPDARGRGVGQGLLAAWERAASRHGAHRLYLEVADGNVAALGMYARAGWVETGRRRGYYGPGRDARVMVKGLVG